MKENGLFFDKDELDDILQAIIHTNVRNVNGLLDRLDNIEFRITEKLDELN
jgi:hypothetical protein